MTRRPATIFLVIALTLGGLAAGAAGAAGATATPTTPRPVEHRCVGGDARCGHVVVPWDRSGHVAGTLSIGYERYPHKDRAQPALETIVAVEGGPGYATTASRGSYRSLFRPMAKRHDLLLVDLRGTGTSGPVRCADLQHIESPYTDWVRFVGECGTQLGARSNLYSSADAADDLADVLDALGIAKIDLYGDSYGTFFSQTFAIRHPDRVRAVVLDAAYPVDHADPWWRDLARAAVSGYRLSCARDPGCAARRGDVVRRLHRFAKKVAANPITGVAPDADGHMGRATIDPNALIQIFDGGGYVFDPYRELDAAIRAASRKVNPDPAPLLRLAREQIVGGDAGPADEYSQGLAVAVECTDYPQLYPMDRPPADRPAAYAQAIADLKQHDPNGFYPWTVQQEVSSPDEDYDTCLQWPVPAHAHPLLPPGAHRPNVPVLVLVGDLDSVTSAEGAKQVADSFPNSTFVEVSNMIHVSALGDPIGCASGIVLRFVRTLDAGDTSCASRYPEIRVVDRFVRSSRAIEGTPSRRAGFVALSTVADVMARWEDMAGYDGVGLRGGTFSTTGYDHRRWTLDRVKWVNDVGVSGRARFNAVTGATHATVDLDGALTGWQVRLRWNSNRQLAMVKVDARSGGSRFRFQLPVQ